MGTTRLLLTRSEQDCVKFLFKRTHLKKEMESTGENVGVYAEAKGEYTRQLCQFLVPALLGYFLQMVDEAKEKDTDSKKLLWNFQNLLKDVPDWNVDKVRRETTPSRPLQSVIIWRSS